MLAVVEVAAHHDDVGTPPHRPASHHRGGHVVADENQRRARPSGRAPNRIGRDLDLDAGRGREPQHVVEQIGVGGDKSGRLGGLSGDDDSIGMRELAWPPRVRDRVDVRPAFGQVTC